MISAQALWKTYLSSDYWRRYLLNKVLILIGISLTAHGLLMITNTYLDHYYHQQMINDEQSYADKFKQEKEIDNLILGYFSKSMDTLIKEIDQNAEKYGLHHIKVSVYSDTSALKSLYKQRIELNYRSKSTDSQEFLINLLATQASITIIKLDFDYRENTLYTNATLEVFIARDMP